MTLDEFMAATAERLPSASDLIGLCDSLGIRFGVAADGKPALKVKDGNREEGDLIARLLKREPWRAQVIEAKKLDRPKPGRRIAVLKGGDDSEVEEVLPCEPTRENLRQACLEHKGKQLALEAPSVDDPNVWVRFGWMSWPRSHDPKYHPQP